MNNLLRVAFRMSSCRSLLHPMRTSLATGRNPQRQLARNLWLMCNSKNDHRPSKLCTCGCMQAHTKAITTAEKDLVEFLTEEILSERKAQKSKTLPAEIDGFKVQLNGAEVVLTKQLESEQMRIRFNVNHTVDTDIEADFDPNMDKPDLGELKSEPAFEIEISRGKTTWKLSCSFVTPDNEGGSNDKFGIDELSIYDGEWSENIYAVSGEVMDTNLYDLVLNYLEEKGISNEFVEKLSQFSTSYEHSAYISLLEGMSKFASGK